jgi:NADH-quinone oxidoreductase subunit I
MMAETSDQPAPHGSIELIEPACTSCMICARECPSWCITIDSHTEPIPPPRGTGGSSPPESALPPGVRERTRNVLDRFVIDWSLCMYCGICVDECPFDALEWVANPVGSAWSTETLRQHWSQASAQP